MDEDARNKAFLGPRESQSDETPWAVLLLPIVFLKDLSWSSSI